MVMVKPLDTFQNTLKFKTLYLYFIIIYKYIDSQLVSLIKETDVCDNIK